MTLRRSAFPGGHHFAFTILDDTDDTTVANGKPVYDLLARLGLRTTKTVWALNSPPELQGPYFAAETLENEEYLAWVRQLANSGFEIAFHNASMGSSRRERTVEALAVFDREFPGMPRLHCNHGQNRENLHWGADRYSAAELTWAYRLASRLGGGPPYEGHRPDSPYYWGDIAAARIAYVRRFAFAQLNCAAIRPGGLYFDPRKPDVPLWFNTADAPDAASFKRLVTKSAVDTLHAAGGWCIVSTHLGKGFARDGRVDLDVQRILEYVASLPGWFVPASELLDHLHQQNGHTSLGPVSRRAMEYRHVLDRLGQTLRG